MLKILNCYLYAKKSYDTLSKGAIFFGHPCIYIYIYVYTRSHLNLLARVLNNRR